MKTLKEIKTQKDELEKKIRDADLEIASLEGQKKGLMDTLKETWDCNTAEAAEALVAKKQKDVLALQEEQLVLETDLKDIEAANA